MRILSFILLVLGLLITGVLGTGTALLFYWPGCLLLGCAGLIAGVRWKMRIHFAPSDLCLGSAALLALYLVARAWWSPVAVYAREDIFVVLGCFVAYLLTSTVASHPRWRVAILLVLALLVAGNLVVGFIHFSGRSDFHLVPHFHRTFGGGRIGGFFNNANHLGAFLVMFILLGAGITFFGRGGVTRKLLLGFVCVAAAIGVALTKSRGALIGLGAGAVTFAVLSAWVFWRTQRHMFGRILLGYGVMFALAGGVLYLVSAEAQKHREASSPLSSDIRLKVWSSALVQHAMQPATGMGSRMFYDYSVALRPAELASYQGDPLFAHNEYLQMLADYGWAGLALMLIVLGQHAGHGVRFIRWFGTHKFPLTGQLSSHTLAFAVGGLSALAATLVHAFFEFHFHVAATAVTAAVLMGLLANPGFDSQTTQALRVPGVRPVCKLMLIAASLWLVGGAIWLGPADWWMAKSEMAQQEDDMRSRVEYLDKAISRDSHNAEAFYMRGLAFIDQWRPALPKQVGDRVLAKAAADLERALAINPLHYVYATALVDVYDAQGRESDGLRVALQAVKSAPLHEEARLALAMHYHRNGRFLEAERAYLWAQNSGQRNTDKEFGWYDGYQQLLKEVAAKK